ncbi:uncharacterized protein DS421_6g194950 [Arachis hypogaea]|nr:uncharacterized protein DS421_6g194950 [Arachis hypogaea]
MPRLAASCASPPPNLPSRQSPTPEEQRERSGAKRDAKREISRASSCVLTAAEGIVAISLVPSFHGRRRRNTVVVTSELPQLGCCEEESAAATPLLPWLSWCSPHPWLAPAVLMLSFELPKEPPLEPLLFWVEEKANFPAAAIIILTAATTRCSCSSLVAHGCCQNHRWGYCYLIQPFFLSFVLLWLRESGLELRSRLLVISD